MKKLFITFLLLFSFQIVAFADFDVKVGKFALDTSGGGTQSVVIESGFQPVAIIFMLTRYSSDGGNNNVILGYGAATGATEEWAVGVSTQTGVLTSNSTRSSSDSSCIIAGHVSNGSGLYLDADLASFDANGFTLNHNTYYATEATQVYYIAFKGSDITNAKAGAWLLPSSSGNNSTTAPGFEPSLLMLATIGAGTQDVSAGSHAIMSLGFTDGTDEFIVSGSDEDAVPTSDSERFQPSTTDAVMSQTFNGSVTWEAGIVSFDASGFTLNYSASTSGDYGFYLALGGDFQTKVTSSTSSSGGGSAVSQEFSPTSFTPSAAIIGSYLGIDNAGLQADMRWSWGFTSGTTEEALLQIYSDDGEPTTSTCNYQASNKIIAYNNGSACGTSVFDADLSSFDSDGMTINWATEPSSAISMGFVYFAGASGGTPPTATGRRILNI